MQYRFSWHWVWLGRSFIPLILRVILFIIVYSFIRSKNTFDWRDVPIIHAPLLLWYYIYVCFVWLFWWRENRLRKMWNLKWYSMNTLENETCTHNFFFLLWIRVKVHFQTKHIISYNDSVFCLDHLKFQSVLLKAQTLSFHVFSRVNLRLKQGPPWWSRGNLYEAVTKHNEHNWELGDLVQIMLFTALRYI